MNLFEYAVKHTSTYPNILGYHYRDVITPELLNELNKHEFVFVSSDYAVPIDGYNGFQFMTSSDSIDTWMWLQQEFSQLPTLPYSEYTEVPTVGFVGRVPVFARKSGNYALHAGFEPRQKALAILYASNEICTDFHIHHEPDGDSAGFWNQTRPDFKKNGPLFKTNMLANQYQVCARGNANWSLRFYETLAYGRMPILIDSGGKFPLFQGTMEQFEEGLGWVPFPIVYPGDDIEKAVLLFHEGICNQDEMNEAQADCREFYEIHFSQEAQIKKFEENFEDYGDW